MYNDHASSHIENITINLALANAWDDDEANLYLNLV